MTEFICKFVWLFIGFTEGAIVEPVKNAYDADADTCVVAAEVRGNKADSGY